MEDVEGVGGAKEGRVLRDCGATVLVGYGGQARAWRVGEEIAVSV